MKWNMWKRNKPSYWWMVLSTNLLRNLSAHYSDGRFYPATLFCNALDNARLFVVCTFFIVFGHCSFIVWVAQSLPNYQIRFFRMDFVTKFFRKIIPHNLGGLAKKVTKKFFSRGQTTKDYHKQKIAQKKKQSRWTTATSFTYWAVSSERQQLIIFQFV